MKYQRISADELFAALRLGSESIVRELVSRDALVAESRNDSGLSAVLYCLYGWDLSMLETLLAASPKLDIFEASALGRLLRVSELLAANPDLLAARSADGASALHLACFYGQPEIVEYLLRCGANPCLRACNENGTTPLHEAASTGQVDIVLMLLQHGAQVNQTDCRGWTALHSAAANGQLHVVDALVKFGTRVCRTEGGQSPRDLAAANGYLETARALESHPVA